MNYIKQWLLKWACKHAVVTMDGDGEPTLVTLGGHALFIQYKQPVKWHLRKALLQRDSQLLDVMQKSNQYRLEAYRCQEQAKA